MADNNEPFVMPEDLKGKSPEEIAQLYSNTRSEYEKYKSEWEPRSKEFERWSRLGNPDELEQVVNWGKTVAAPIVQKLAKGEAYLLNDADYKAYQNWAEKTKNGTAPPASAPDEELFGPVEKRLEEKLIAAANRLINERAAAFDQNINRGFKTLQDQQNLFAHVMRLQKQNPNLDIDAVMKKGAETASMSPEQLLAWIIDSESKTSGMEAEIEKRVAAKLAEKDAEKQNDQVKTLLGSRRAGGGLPNRPMKTAERTKALVEDLNKKFPGIWDQIPLA
jgi:hypothetical protein